jgi:hypothetical protein
MLLQWIKSKLSQLKEEEKQNCIRKNVQKINNLKKKTNELESVVLLPDTGSSCIDSETKRIWLNISGIANEIANTM